MKASIPAVATDEFEARAAELRARVAEAAQALKEQGIPPTVTRVRAALGGGSPNDVAPALKAWREATPLRGDTAQGTLQAGGMPAPIADLARELWHRAAAAAVLELKHGPKAAAIAARAGEIQGLRAQVSSLREQLERDARAYGELRAQAARHETIAREALARAEDAERRTRDLLRELGEARQEVAQLTAQLKQRSRSAHAGTASKGGRALRRRGRPTPRPKPTPRTHAASAPKRQRAASKRASRRSKVKSASAQTRRRSPARLRSTRPGQGQS